MSKFISRAAQSIIDGDPAVQDAIQRGYKPRVEEQIGKKVKMQSLITAVKRCKVNFQSPTGKVARVISESTINVRTDVAKITVEKTRATISTVRKVLGKYFAEFLQVLEGISTITLIVDQKIFSEIRTEFPANSVLDEKTELAAIIVHSPKAIIDTPGCTISFYNPISRRGVNIEETMSCYTDTIMVIKMEDVGRAFNALNDLITGMRRQTHPKRSPHP